MKGNQLTSFKKEGITIDKQGFCDSIHLWEDEMYRICKSILLNEKDCCDAIQNTIYIGYKKLNTLKEDKFFKTWLFRILINECNAVRRVQKRMVETESAILEALRDEREDYSDLYLCIDTLNNKFRQIIILYYIDGYSTTEIGEMLQISDGTVKSRLFNARKELKRLYGEASLI